MAKNKTKEISVSAWEKVIKDSAPNEVCVDWHGNELVIKKTIGIAETITFVDTCITVMTESDLGYMPELFDFIYKTCVLAFFTNVRIPDNNEKKCDLIYKTDIINTVMIHANDEQLEELKASVWRKFKFKCDAAIDSLRKEISDIVDQFGNIGNSMESMFEGVSKDDMGNMVKLLSGFDSDVNENAVLNAVVDKVMDGIKGE